MKKIFVVDDEERIRKLIAMYLEKEGYNVSLFSNAKNALQEFYIQKPDLMVLDIMMEEMDGLDLCRQIRKTSEVPIVFVSARSEELDRILGLELGADDYLSKPFSPRELMVRIKKILKRTENIKQNSSPKEPSYVVKLGELSMYPEMRMTKFASKDISFTSKEFDILLYLVENVGIPMSREKITHKIWGENCFGYDRSVDDTVKRIRKKLRENNVSIQIETVWGYGYKVASNE